jgi:hypothetical protein
VKRRPAQVVACGASVLAAHAALAQAACGDALGAGTLVATSPRYEVAFRPEPAIAVSRHFALDVVVCPKDGAPDPAAIAVDASMPEHRHGMNYRPSVAATGAGRWRAEGLLLHMPGAWEFRFDLATTGGSERATLRRDIP